MQVIIYGKEDCGYCVKAKDYCESKGITYKYLQLDVDFTMEHLQDTFPRARSFPQILESNGNYVGGYDQLVKTSIPTACSINAGPTPLQQEVDRVRGRLVPPSEVDLELLHLSSRLEAQATMADSRVMDIKHVDNSVLADAGWKSALEALPSDKPKKTVFNQNSSLEYPLFLGDQLGLTDTINQPYPILETLYDEQIAQIWNHTEVDLTQDRMDMDIAPRSTTDLMVKTVTWQWVADSIASRAITGILLDYVTNSDLEAWYNVVALFESIHAKTYSHIVKQTFVDPNQAITDAYADMEAVKRSEVLCNAFDDLSNLPWDAPMQEKEDKLILAIVTLYLLESLNFMASFAITFGIAETGVFQGISQNVTLICRDELLHARGGNEILKIMMKTHPEAFARLQPKILEVFNAVVKGEDDWTDHLFSEGRYCIGINAPLIKSYVRWVADIPAQVLGIEFTAPKSNPLPYMDSYIDTSKVQVAAQELQLTSYLLNSVLPVKDEAKLTEELVEEFGDY